MVKVTSNDLATDGRDELAGYWGGFSGDVDGEVFGFLSPLFNGEEFHGNAVQVHRPFCGRRMYVHVYIACKVRGRCLRRGTNKRTIEGSLGDGGSMSTLPLVQKIWAGRENINNETNRTQLAPQKKVGNDHQRLRVP